MKKRLIAAVILAVMSASGVNAYAAAFEGSADYYFESDDAEGFYNRGEQQYNREGAIPPELLDLYDFTAATTLTETPNDAPSAENLSATYEDAPQIAPMNTDDYPDTWAGLVVNDNPYTVTPVEELRNSDGSIGRLQIPAIGLDVKVYDGDALAAMKKGVGHIEGTSVWDSNVGMVGHNRGTNDYFGKLKTLGIGDTILYATKAGTRTYRVIFADQISDTDWSMLRYTTDNRLSLVTCVENVPNKRILIQCAEAR
jgi:LPXTG-site transpeptidase (sortase) family protein